MLFHSIKLQNFLSFGPDSQEVPLRPLNVLVGPNGSGKSNFLDCFELLRFAPTDLRVPIRIGGGVRDWLWKGKPEDCLARVEVVLENSSNLKMRLRYKFGFTEANQRFEITEERIENEQPYKEHDEPYLYYTFTGDHGILNIKGDTRKLQHEDIDITTSVLSQRKDPDQYPEITYLGNVLSKIRCYREWQIGRASLPRGAQKADLPNDFLDPRAENLGLIINSLGKSPQAKQRFLKALRVLYDGIEDTYVSIEANTVQLFFQERGQVIPATRLSDGTLRYLFLLAILCHPTPPPVVCIEEPELGLHPDVLPTIAELLVEASERCQLFVTTHSEILVDALTDHAESVLICERNEHGSQLKRLDSSELGPWLEKYRLGELWTSGEIGGVRW